MKQESKKITMEQSEVFPAFAWTKVTTIMNKKKDWRGIGPSKRVDIILPYE